ncbi:MAG TPA: hypothetical protein ENN85_04840 [Methanoculleus sp.]|nr:hypothetical protein [Methanoculleus sp.]
MTDGECDICHTRGKRLVAVMSKATLRHVCSECFFERFMGPGGEGFEIFEEEPATAGIPGRAV